MSLGEATYARDRVEERVRSQQTSNIASAQAIGTDWQEMHGIMTLSRDVPAWTNALKAAIDAFEGEDD